MNSKRIVVLGGGAAGFFGAIRCAATDPEADVQLIEATQHPLAKVRVSGGGRCNVTHACFEPRDLAARYPRGARELRGPFTRFGPRETIEWFGARGVKLKTEADGRMFPATDSSATIVDCLRSTAEHHGVAIRTACTAKSVTRNTSGGFDLCLGGGKTMTADRLLLATGGNRGSAGIAMAESLGHSIEPQVPSLFTFHIDDPRLTGLEGVAVPDATVSVPEINRRERGPVLITHWGLSGPAILSLSAWGARELHALGYRFVVRIQWSGGLPAGQTIEALATARTTSAKRQLGTTNPLGLPSRLWLRLVDAAGLDPIRPWTSLPNASIRELAREVAVSEFAVSGKSMNKEEFVTCGGVRLREVDFRTMESRRCPGLFFAGEVLDIDGVTGGFNFQAAWTTAWLAGSAMGAGIGPHAS